MADLYLKALESERKQLWATCRLKGLAIGTPERNRIAAIGLVHGRLVIDNQNAHEISGLRHRSDNRLWITNG